MAHAASLSTISLLLLASGCSHGRATVGRNIHQDGRTAYRVGWLPPDWRRIHVKNEDLAFAHPDGGTIFAHATCERVEDAPLDVLANHMLFDIEIDREVSRTEMTLDGRKALRSTVIGELDGVPIEIDLVVLRKNGCVYDLGLIADRDTFPKRLADFDVFVHGFERLG